MFHRPLYDTALRAVGILWLAFLTGCGGEDIAQSTDRATLEVGYFAGAEFDALDDGDRLTLVDGIQGGTWIMPGLRAYGIDARVEVEGELLVDGTPIGWLVPGPLLLDDGPDGSVEIAELAMPVPDQGARYPAFVAYDDETAILTLVLQDAAGRRAGTTIEVLLSGL